MHVRTTWIGNVGLGGWDWIWFEWCFIVSVDKVWGIASVNKVWGTNKASVDKILGIASVDKIWGTNKANKASVAIVGFE